MTAGGQAGGHDFPVSTFHYHLLEWLTLPTFLACLLGPPVALLVVKRIWPKFPWVLCFALSVVLCFVSLLLQNRFIQFPFDYEDEQRNPPSDPLGLSESGADELAAMYLGVPFGILSTGMVFAVYVGAHFLARAWGRRRP